VPPVNADSNVPVYGDDAGNPAPAFCVMVPR
jgi:hypothetical protein